MESHSISAASGRGTKSGPAITYSDQSVHGRSAYTLKASLMFCQYLAALRVAHHDVGLKANKVGDPGCTAFASDASKIQKRKCD